MKDHKVIIDVNIWISYFIKINQNNFILLLLLTYSFTNGQQLIEKHFIKVDNNYSPQKFNQILLKSNTLKNENCLNYYCDENLKISLCNDLSEDKYVDYQELGTINDSKIAIIQKTTYNEEWIILVHQKLCKQTILKGFPLQIENTNQYVVYNNPSTDIPYVIQIINILDDEITIQDEISLPEYIKPKRLFFIKDNEAFILDINNQLWKTIIKN